MNPAPKPDTRLWHPFANMAAVRHSELVVSRAEGNWVWSEDGRRFLDATASLWYANVGHGRREIVDAIAAQAGSLEAYSTFGDYANEPARRLAGRLADLAPVDDAKVFLGTGGGDGIETAAKLARYYWQTTGQPERTHIVTRERSYHGTHGFGTSMAGIEANRVGFGELVPGSSTVPWDSSEALEGEIEQIGPDRVAAFFCEPVIGAGGVYPPPPGYIPEVAEVCARHGVLLVVDSVICGFGRLGSWFGVERWGVRPDMVVFAKGVTSGYLPLGGVVVSGRVASPFWEGDGQAFRHGPTYAGHPTCCAAALANLDILARDDLVGRGARLEGNLLESLAGLEDHPAVSGVRGGVGLLAAVELSPEALGRRSDAVSDLHRAVRDAGVLVRPLRTAVAVSPPLTIEDDELALIAGAIAQGLDRLA